jgi:hypothetical protein
MACGFTYSRGCFIRQGTSEAALRAAITRSGGDDTAPGW